MFPRSVKGDGTVTGPFLFKHLAHTFIVAGHDRVFDVDKERHSNNALRQVIAGFKQRVCQLVDPLNPSAVRRNII